MCVQCVYTNTHTMLIVIVYEYAHLFKYVSTCVPVSCTTVTVQLYVCIVSLFLVNQILSLPKCALPALCMVPSVQESSLEQSLPAASLYRWGGMRLISA